MNVECSEQQQQQPQNSSLSLDALISIESASTLHCHHHQQSVARLPASQTYNFLWRRRIAEWFYNVVDHFDETRDIVYVAINFFDRYHADSNTHKCCSTSEPTPSSYQLVAITAIFLAIRIRGHVSIDLPQLIQISNSSHRVPDVLRIGTLLLKSISWEHRLLTPQDFIISMLKQTQSSLSSESIVQVLDHASYMSELAVMDDRFIGVLPSQVARAAMYCAIQDLNVCHFTTEQFDDLVVHKHFVDVAKRDLHALASQLKRIYLRSFPDSPSNPLVSDVEDDDDNTTSEESDVIFFNTTATPVSTKRSSELVGGISENENPNKRLRC